MVTSAVAALVALVTSSAAASEVGSRCAETVAVSTAVSSASAVLRLEALVAFFLAYDFYAVHIDLLDADLVALFDVPEEHLFRFGNEHDRLSFSTRATGTADAVDVGFRIFRYVVVDDEVDIVHIETACRYVGGDEGRDFAALETLEGALALALFEVAVEEVRADAVFHEHACEVFGFRLGAGEDDGLLIRVFGNVLLEKVELFEVGDFNERVVDLVYGDRGGSLDVFVSFAHVLRDEVADFERDGGREGHRLLDVREERPNVVDVVDEAHVEHAVHFVENEEFDVGDVDEAAVDEVDETSRGSYDDLRSLHEDFALGTDAGSTVYGGRADEHAFGKLDDFVADLAREFTGRSKDDSLGTADFRIDLLEKRDDERGGLTGTGLGLTYDVLSFENGADDFFLDFGRFDVTCLGEGIENVLIEGKL